jgi:hypothetical protein
MTFLPSIATMALAAACLLGASTASAATVAYYKFENGVPGERAKGSGSILDSSGNGLDGTPIAKPRYVAVSNPASSVALEFDGETQRVRIHDNPLFQLTHSLTLEAYVYVDSHFPGGYTPIIFRGDHRFGRDPYILALSAGGALYFRINDASNNESLVTSLYPLPEKQWLHVAATLDDATGIQAVYVNGKLDASRVTSIRPLGPLKKKHDRGLGIGGTQEGCPCFHGMIDDVRISDVALDPSQFLPPP